MDKKIVRISGRCLTILLWVLLALSVSSLIFVVLGQVLPDFNPVGYIYTFTGEIMMAVQFLISGEAELTKNYIPYVICFALAVVIICICAIKDLINVYGHRSKFSPNKKFSFISSLIFCGIFFVYFTFNLIVFCVNYNKFLTFLTANAPGFVINMTNGADIIMVKNIIICVLFIVASAVVFFAFMLNREKEQKQQIKQAFNFNFYSDEYEQKESNEIKPVEVEPERQEEQQEAEKAKPKKQAQDLVTRIMQLNELKDTGQISDVEYTKLRQKAIKRYKA